MSRRVIVEVRYSRSEKLWMGKRRDLSGGVLFYARTKREAMKAASKEAKALGTLAQVVVYRLNGSIQEEFTFGADPRRRRG